MVNVFKVLQSKLDVDKREGGISPLELADLPPGLRKLMRVMLREVEMMLVDLRQVVAELPEGERMSDAELDTALATLCRQNWLITRGEGDRIRYEVNLRRKQGSVVARGVWNALDDRIDQMRAESRKLSQDDK